MTAFKNTDRELAVYLRSGAYNFATLRRAHTKLDKTYTLWLSSTCLPCPELDNGHWTFFHVVALPTFPCISDGAAAASWAVKCQVATEWVVRQADVNGRTQVARYYKFHIQSLFNIAQSWLCSNFSLAERTDFWKKCSVTPIICL